MDPAANRFLLGSQFQRAGRHWARRALGLEERKIVRKSEFNVNELDEKFNPRKIYYLHKADSEEHADAIPPPAAHNGGEPVHGAGGAEYPGGGGLRRIKD